MQGVSVEGGAERWGRERERGKSGLWSRFTVGPCPEPELPTVVRRGEPRPACEGERWPYRSLTGVVRSGDMLREPPLLLMAGLRVPGCVFAGDRSRNRSRWASGK